MKECIKKHIDILFIIGVFVFFIGFHCVFYPMYIYDTDDWTYISYKRAPIPQVGSWNPCRILPEILMPFISKIGVYFIAPILSKGNIPDYVNGMALSFGIFYALVWTIYIGCIYKLLRILIKQNESMYSILGTLFVLLAHFMIFDNHTYLYYSNTVTTVFYYSISLLLNVILVMLTECHILSNKIREGKYELKFTKGYLLGFYIVLGYLCIFSNIIDSIIAATYFASLIIVRGMTLTKINKDELIEFVKETHLFIIYVVVWFVSAFIELTGRRADSINTENYDLIGETIESINLVANQLGMFWIGGLLVITAGCIWIVFHRRETEIKLYFDGILKMIIMFEIIAIFYIIMGTRTGSYYLVIGLMSGAMVPIVIIGTYVIALLIDRFRIVPVVLPMMIFVISFLSVFDENYYQHYNGISPQNVYRLDNYIIESALEADKKGEEEVIILVPKYTSNDNFPIAVTYGGTKISRALYNLGITSKYIHIELVASEKINEEYEIPIR